MQDKGESEGENQGENVFHFYIGKTRRPFQKRWSEHAKETGVNHKVRALKDSLCTLSTHILLDFTLVPANYQTASLLGGLEVIMNAVLGPTMAQGRLRGLNVNVVDFVPIETTT